MINTDLFSLQTQTDGQAVTPNQPEQSVLLCAGEPTGLTVEGVELEAQFEHDGKYLLFVTENSPYEEGLHIYLVSRGNTRFQLLDSVALGLPYAAGMLRNVRFDSSNRIHFEFPNSDNKYVCSVLRQPRRFVNPVKIMGINRSNWFFQQRYLQLEKDSNSRQG